MKSIKDSFYRSQPVAMVMRPGRLKMLKSFEEGDNPADFLYGFSILQKHFDSVDLFEFKSKIEENFFLRWLGRLEVFFSFLFLFNIKLSVACQWIRQLQNYKIVFTNIDSIGLTFALLRKIIPFRFKIVHISQGLCNTLDQGDVTVIQRLQRSLTRYVLSEIDQVIVLGEGAKSSYISNSLIHHSRIVCLQFGVDVNFWSPDNKRETLSGDYILSVGSDDGRDYQTLLQANLKHDLKIVTRQSISTNSGVEVFSEISDLELRDLYRNCICLVIPLKNISQPSGQSATLQAMACGKAVFISNTVGFWDRDRFIHNQNIVLVPLTNPEEFGRYVEQKIESIPSLEKIGLDARMLLVREFSFEKFGYELVNVGKLAISSNHRLVV